MTDQDIFYEYEQVILGKRKNYPSELFAGNTESGKELIALRFFKCIFEKYLKWTPEQAYHSLNANIIKTMKLAPLVRFIRFPPEFDPMIDCFYIVAKVYPDKFKISEKKQTEIVYKRVMNDEVSRYPKFFFEGRDGMMRALFCLRYALKEYGDFRNADEMYRHFALHGTDFLKKCKLYDAYAINFEGKPIDFLHNCFNKYDRDAFDFIYNKYRYMSEYNEVKKKK